MNIFIILILSSVYAINPLPDTEENRQNYLRYRGDLDFRPLYGGETKYNRDRTTSYAGYLVYQAYMNLGPEGVYNAVNNEQLIAKLRYYKDHKVIFRGMGHKAIGSILSFYDSHVYGVEKQKQYAQLSKMQRDSKIQARKTAIDGIRRMQEKFGQINH